MVVVVYLQVATLDRNEFFLASSLAVISFAFNPFIYASRYEVFRRQLKKMLGKTTITTA